MFDLAVFILPARAPGTGNTNEGLVRVVVMHHRTFARHGATITQIETLGDLDRRHARRGFPDR